MFDTSKVANNIKAARTKMNMTQMNLADEMGVSYQAVSNWERGNSMPDISRLQELCNILDVSFEELVGEKSQQTEIVERLMLDEETEVTLEEIVQVAPLIKPDKIEKKAEETIDNDDKISFSTLIGLAPFMNKETLEKLANKVSNVDIGKLCGLAPFLKRKTLDGIVEKAIKEEKIDTKNIAGLAPFLSKETVKKIADYMLNHGQEKRIIAIAPFMGKDIFSNNVVRDECNDSGMELDDLDEDEVARLAFAALEKGEKIDEYLDYMDEEDVTKLAIKALDLGVEVDIFLDYIDEHDIAELASKAIKDGKNIEVFLDYLDDDVIKSLLLQATRK